MKLLFSLFITILAVVATASPDCPPAKVCYAIDESGSINNKEWNQLQKALIDITDDFNSIAPGSTFSAVGFSGYQHGDGQASVVSTPTTNIPLFKNRLANNPKFGEYTSSGAGLLECKRLLKNLPKPRVILLFTDGVDNRSPSGVSVQQHVKNQDITIAAVGVGDNLNTNALQNIIASAPYLYTPVEDFSSLKTHIADIVNSLCLVSPTPSVTPTYTPAASVAVSSDPTPSVSASVTPAETPSTTPSVSVSASSTPAETPSVSPSVSSTPSESPSESPSVTPSSSAAASTTASATPTASTTPAETPSTTPSVTPSLTPSPSNPLLGKCQFCSDNSECQSGLCARHFCNTRSTRFAAKKCLRDPCKPCLENLHCRTKLCVDGFCIKHKWNGSAQRCLDRLRN